MIITPQPKTQEHVVVFLLQFLFEISLNYFFLSVKKVSVNYNDISWQVLSSESCSCQNMWWSQMASREENVIHLSSWQVIYLCEIVWQIKVYPKNQKTYLNGWTPPLHSLLAVSFFLLFSFALHFTLDNSAGSSMWGFHLRPFQTDKHTSLSLWWAHPGLHNHLYLPKHFPFFFLAGNSQSAIPGLVIPPATDGKASV